MLRLVSYLNDNSHGEPRAMTTDDNIIELAKQHARFDVDAGHRKMPPRGASAYDEAYAAEYDRLRRQPGADEARRTRIARIAVVAAARLVIADDSDWTDAYPYDQFMLEDLKTDGHVVIQQSTFKAIADAIADLDNVDK